MAGCLVFILFVFAAILGFITPTKEKAQPKKPREKDWLDDLLGK